MSDEPEQPQLPKQWICPCCTLSFPSVTKFTEHLEKMKVRVQSAIDKANAPLTAPAAEVLTLVPKK